MLHYTKLPRRAGLTIIDPPNNTWFNYIYRDNYLETLQEKVMTLPDTNLLLSGNKDRIEGDGGWPYEQGLWFHL